MKLVHEFKILFYKSCNDTHINKIFILAHDVYQAMQIVRDEININTNWIVSASLSRQNIGVFDGNNILEFLTRNFPKDGDIYRD